MKPTAGFPGNATTEMVEFRPAVDDLSYSLSPGRLGATCAADTRKECLPGVFRQPPDSRNITRRLICGRMRPTIAAVLRNTSPEFTSSSESIWGIFDLALNGNAMIYFSREASAEVCRT